MILTLSLVTTHVIFVILKLIIVNPATTPLVCSVLNVLMVITIHQAQHAILALAVIQVALYAATHLRLCVLSVSHLTIY